MPFHTIRKETTEEKADRLVEAGQLTGVEVRLVPKDQPYRLDMPELRAQPGNVGVVVELDLDNAKDFWTTVNS